uniref:Uncharacterized protein n=1 Tax=viral metagenome TaxID=1070528 RepID=A0A6C0EAV3_9ZZZZ
MDKFITFDNITSDMYMSPSDDDNNDDAILDEYYHNPSVKIENIDESQYDLHKIKKDEHRSDEEIITESLDKKDKILNFTSVILTKVPSIIQGFDWVKQLVLKKCDLTEITYVPINLVEFVCVENNIKIFDASILPNTLECLEYRENKTKKIINLKEGILKLDVGDNFLSTLDVPRTVIDLKIDNNPFEYLPELSDNIMSLDISRTNIKTLPKLSEKLENFKLSSTSILTINHLPDTLIEFVAYSSDLTFINCVLPSNLQVLDLFGTKIRTLPSLPDSIKFLDLGRLLNITELPNIPEKLEKLDISMTESLKLTSEQKRIIREKIHPENLTWNEDSEFVITPSNEIPTKSTNPFLDYESTNEANDCSEMPTKNRNPFLDYDLTNEANDCSDMSIFWDDDTANTFSRRFVLNKYSSDNPDYIISEVTYVL